MASDTLIEKTIADADGYASTIYYDPDTNRIVSNPAGYLVVKEDAVKSGQIDPKKPNAIPRIIRDDDGTNRTIYVDASTGAELQNTDGYNLLDQYSSNIQDLGLVREVTNKEQQSANQAVAENKVDLGPRGEIGRNPGLAKAPKATEANNYGYIGKPAALGFAGMLPGPIGMAAKVGNMAVNASNNKAAEEAGKVLGFKQEHSLLGLAKDNKGYIGDLSYEGKTTPVGLEAQDKYGRTTLTPREARQRMAMGATQATPEETQKSIDSFKESHPGILSRVMDKVGTSLGLKQAKPEAQPQEHQVGTYTGRTYNRDSSGYFSKPDAINPFSKSVDDPDLPSRDMSKLSYNLGEHRPSVPPGGIGQKVQDVVTDVLGKDFSVSMVSGMGEYGSARHREKAGGVAGDFSITDKNGKAISPEQMKDVAQGMAARWGGNVGFGPEYMGPNVHLDTYDITGKQRMANEWGSTAKKWAPEIDDARMTGTMPASYYDVRNPPTPQAKPTDVNANAFANRTTKFSPEDKSMMAKTLAGELDLSKTDLSTEEGRKEAFGILSTMENRSAKYGSVQKAISAPQQYSTWNTPEASAVANKNYKNNRSVFDGLVDSYTQDPQKNLGYTSYYNDSIAAPDWGGKMKNTTKIGPHTFGSLDEYSSFGTQLAAPETAKPKDTQTYNSLSSFAQGIAAQKAQDSYGFTDPSSSKKSQTDSTDTSKSKSDSTSKSTKSDKGSSGFSSNPGSMASGKSSDRGSVSGYSGGASKSQSSSTGFSGGSMAGARAADRSSVGGYSNGNSSSGGKSKGASSRSDGWN